MVKSQPILTQWKAGIIAEQLAIMARHRPGPDGCCVACVAVGLRYDKSPATHPCGAHAEAQRLINVLTGRP